MKHVGLAVEALSPRDIRAVMATASTLQHAAKVGATRRHLQGKNIGLLLPQADHGDTALFRQAAVELGAHVADIRLNLADLPDPLELQRMAHVLGRLYVAVECQGMASAWVQQMAQGAGVPVFDGIGSTEHPTARLAEILECDAPLTERRLLVVQALLILTIV